MTPAGYLRLEHSRSPYVIELSVEMIPRLLALVEAGRKHGWEVGGLLIGSFPRSAALTLRIENFAAIERRSEDPPPYNLTVEQRARLSTIRHGLIQEQRAVLGFFRSHLRTGKLSLSTEDRNLVAIEFRKAIHVALLIRAEAPHTGAFFVPDRDGVLQSGLPLPELQFDAEEFARQAPVRAPKAPGISDMPESGSEESLQRRKTWLVRRWRDRRIEWVAGAVLFALCLCLTIWAPLTAQLLAGGEALKLTATERSQMIEVRWNRRQRDIEQGAPCVLTITEGGTERRFTLSPAELRVGCILYHPRTARAEFRLSIRLRDGAELVQLAKWPPR